MPTGIELIAAERERQVSGEGYVPEHDDAHKHGDMALAAALYATPVLLYKQIKNFNGVSFRDPWPWELECDKRPRSGTCINPNSPFYLSMDERISQLTKAGALIAAEIDRLQRVKESP